METFAVSFLCSPSKLRKKTGESPVEVSISVNGQRVLWKTQKSCDPRAFKKSLNSKAANNDLKIYCDTIRQRINEIQTTLTVQGIPVTAQRIKDELAGCKKNRRLFREIAEEYLRSKTGNTSIYWKYKIIMGRALENWGKDILIDEVTPQMIIDYHRKYEKKFKQTTLKSEMKRLKSFFIFAFNSGYLTSNPFASLRFTFKENEADFLTYDEIERIRAAKLSEPLDRVRNAFLFLCFSGLEYADIVQLTKDDVKKNQFGQWYVKKKRVKTGVEFISILYEDAAEQFELFDDIPPVISNQKMNAALKKIASSAGITKNVTTLTARHTYCTYLLSVRCLPIEVVQKMAGHTSPRQTLHYAKMLDETVFIANHKNRYPTVRSAPEPTKEDMEDLKRFSELLGID